MARPQQNSFTSGVLNDGLKGRTEIDHYYQGLLQGRNVLCVKEGGVIAAWGTEYIGDGAADARLITIDFDTGVKYCLIFSELKLEIYKDDVLETNINGGGLDYLVTDFTLAQALVMDYAEAGDTLVLCHEDVAPQTLVRGTAAQVWTYGAATLSNLPQYDYNDASSPAPTSHVAEISFTTPTAGEEYTLELNNFTTPAIKYSSTTASNERRIKEEMLALPPTGFDESGITVAHQSAAIYRITFSGDSADAYEIITGAWIGKTAGSIGGTTVITGTARKEDVLSATRGWAGACEFADNRLLLGKLKPLPKALLGTITGGFNPYNFKLGTGLDDEGIFVQIVHPGKIRALYDGRHVQMFTSKGEHYIPDETLTPAPGLPRQSRYGIADGIRPTEVDGATIYVAADNKTIREYLYQWSEEAYAASSLTVLSSDLLNSIVDLDALTSTTDKEDSYILAVNGDGTAAVCNTLRAQDVAAWTEYRHRSGDSIKQMGVVERTIYMYVERSRNGSTVYQLEKASFDTRMEASKEVTGVLGTTEGGFEHLAGETVNIIVDGAPAGTVTVNASGEITLDEAPSTSLEAGYFTPPIIKPMPLVVDMGGGPQLGARKRIKETRLLVKDTLGLVINGVAIPMNVPGTLMTSTPDAPFSGVISSRDAGYTDQDATVTVTQTEPLPLHVLSMLVLLDVGQT